MGHDATIVGFIHSPLNKNTEEPLLYHKKNIAAIEALPGEAADGWPFLIRKHFGWCLSPGPEGYYRTLPIHFGYTLKDIPPGQKAYYPRRSGPSGAYAEGAPETRDPFDEYLFKLESLLKRMFWTRAEVFIDTDFEPRRCIRYHLDGVEGTLKRMATSVPDLA